MKVMSKQKLQTSSDYSRLADLIEQGALLPVGKIHDGREFWFGCAEYTAPEDDDGYHNYRAMDGEDYRGAQGSNEDKAAARAEFIADCAAWKIFFIDPASQHQPRTFDCVPCMSIEDALKQIPEGASINMEERFVMSLAWDCNGEPVHERWGEDETPMGAILRLYERVKKIERENSL